VLSSLPLGFVPATFAGLDGTLPGAATLVETAEQLRERLNKQRSAVQIVGPGQLLPAGLPPMQ
jgi:hypothetical protein